MNYAPSDDLINELIYSFEEVRDNNFRIGDLLVEEVERNKHVTKADIFRSIAGHLAINIKTLYSYELTARRWSAEDRASFQNMDWSFYKETDPSKKEDRELLEKAVDEHKNVNWLLSEKYNIPPDKLLNQSIHFLKNLVKEHWMDEKHITEEIFILVSNAQESLEMARELLDDTV